MAKFIINIPEEIHDRLRIRKVKEKRNIQEIIIDAILQYLKTKRGESK